ncbi:MAG: hypothetical protein JSU66_01500 [Deltaproteobacteria bacterium]|nr:MAG: hypothetical protein JSU66_01500 [Deltaproteobacteria bacterium]
MPSHPSLRRLLREILRAICFPWLIWSATAWIPRHLRRTCFPAPGAGRALVYALHTVLYVSVGLPLTVFVSGEALITANETLIGEQANYRLQSDYEAGLSSAALEVPGPRTPRPAPVPEAQSEAYRRHLVELYAPVIVNKVAHHPEWDIPVALDFDGNANPRDNVNNEPRFRPHTAAVYGELTAETEDSLYFTYSLYRVKDYDHPLRELLTDWTFHDSDNEGLMLRVDKDGMRVVELSTWFHNRFLYYNHSGESAGSEPVHGKIWLEDDTHVLIYSQSQGHGVRALQVSDLDALSRSVKILRHRGNRAPVPVRADRRVQIDGTYELVSFDDWYAQALGPFGSKGQGEGLFEESIPLGRMPDGREIRIGRYIAGWDYSKVGWSRPKPPWSWDDGWDRIPIFVWHFLPSHGFASHGGTQLSHRYLHNRPLEKTFGADGPQVLRSLRLGLEFRPDAKWENLEQRGGNLPHRTYWRAIELGLKHYVNYLFHALG